MRARAWIQLEALQFRRGLVMRSDTKDGAGTSSRYAADELFHMTDWAVSDISFFKVWVTSFGQFSEVLLAVLACS